MTIDLSKITVADFVALQKALQAGDIEGVVSIVERYAAGVREMPAADFFAALRAALEALVPKM